MQKKLLTMFLFCRRFNLIESKETDVLRDLEIALRLTDDPAPPPSSESNSASSATNNHTSTSNMTTSSSPTTASTTTTTSSDDSQHNNHQHHQNHCNNSSLIDGDANVLPICTQPESGIHPSSGEQSDIRSAGGGGVGFSCAQQTETA